MIDELKRSMGRGSAHFLSVARQEDYVIRKGVVTVQASEGKMAWLNALPTPPALPSQIRQPEPQEDLTSYMPFAHPELPVKLSKLKNGASKAVLDFVRKYGMLGRNQQIGRAHV
jgi:hypothetical protein